MVAARRTLGDQKGVITMRRQTASPSVPQEPAALLLTSRTMAALGVGVGLPRLLKVTELALAAI